LRRHLARDQREPLQKTRLTTSLKIHLHRLLASTPLLLVVNAALPAKSVLELIALAKARVGQLNYASSGTGTIVHLAGESFKTMAGVDLLARAHKGSAQRHSR